MKNIIILTLLNIFLNANTLLLNIDENTNIKLSSNMQYFVTSYETTNSFDILNSKELKNLTKSNLWLQLDKEVWTKVSIKNINEKKKSLILVNPLALSEHIEIWVYKNNILVQNLKSGILEKRDYFNKFSRFINIKLDLDSQEEYQIITKIVNQKGSVDVEWFAISEKEFEKLLFFDNFMWSTILCGIFLLLILNIFLYFTLRKKSFASYIFYISFCGIYFFTNSGYFALFFGNGLINIIVPHLSAYAIFPFYILFLDKYLELSKNNRYLYIIKPAYLYFTFIALTSWVIIFSPIIYQYDYYYFLLTFTMLLTLVLITFREYYLRKTISIFYILGQISLLLGYITFFLFSLNIIQRTLYNQQIIGFCMFLEMILFTLAIFLRLKNIVEIKQKDEKLILSQSHFSTIGQMLKNVSHQWKVPAVRLGILITEIESILYINKSKQPRVDNIIKDMRQNIDFMEKTIVEFSQFYSKSEEIVDFKPINEIYDIKTMLQERINLQNLSIEYLGSIESFSIKGNSTTFAHIVLILIENVLDVSKARNIASPKLKIYIENLKNKNIISFEDNCGGIKQSPINKIFELEVSSSNEKNRGVGLTIAKMLTEEKLNSTLVVVNTNLGAKFSIIL